MMQPQEVHLFRVAVNYHQYAVYVSSLPFQNVATPSNEIKAVIFQNREQLHNPYYVRESSRFLGSTWSCDQRIQHSSTSLSFVD